MTDLEREREEEDAAQAFANNLATAHALLSNGTSEAHRQLMKKLVRTLDQRDTLLAALREIALDWHRCCTKETTCDHAVARAAIAEVEGEK